MRLLTRLLATSLLISTQLANAVPPWSSYGEATAIQGFDPVAYFTKGDAVRGSSKFAYEFQGISWFFASAEHRDLFSANPEKYLPQLGGFCSVSVANGKNARGSGQAWIIHEGKLYLNYSKEVMNTFKGDPEGYISKASGWWPSVKSRIEGQ